MNHARECRKIAAGALRLSRAMGIPPAAFPLPVPVFPSQSDYSTLRPADRPRPVYDQAAETDQLRAALTAAGFAPRPVTLEACAFARWCEDRQLKPTATARKAWLSEVLR